METPRFINMSPIGHSPEIEILPNGYLQLAFRGGVTFVFSCEHVTFKPGSTTGHAA
jgi:hypothetical protein